LPTSLCSRQREVGAAPHRGNANRPLTIQGKALRKVCKSPGIDVSVDYPGSRRI
jgi:hypothetical protein